MAVGCEAVLVSELTLNDYEIALQNAFELGIKFAVHGNVVYAKWNCGDHQLCACIFVQAAAVGRASILSLLPGTFCSSVLCFENNEHLTKRQRPRVFTRMCTH